MRAPPRFTKSASSLTSQSRDSHNPDGRNSWLNGDARPSWSAQPDTTPSTPVSQPRHPRRNHWRATCAERRMRWFGRRALLCPEFRRTQGSVTGSCRVFIRYGRIRPLGSCGRWADTVVVPLGPGYRQGSFLPPPPDDPLPAGQVKGTLRVSLRDQCRVVKGAVVKSRRIARRRGGARWGRDI